MFSAMLLPRTNDTCDSGHTHLIVFVHACGYYLRMATIRGAASIRINMVCYCPDGLMVKLSIYRVVPICMCRFNPVWSNFSFFFLNFFCCKVMPAEGFQLVFNDAELLYGANERAG